VSGWVVFARVLYENEPVGHMYGHTAMTVIWICLSVWNKDTSSVDIVNTLRAGRLEFDPRRFGNFSPHHRVQTGSGAHRAFCPMGTEGSFSGGKAAGVWNWPLTFIQSRG
jgi:hypothetical protein